MLMATKHFLLTAFGLVVVVLLALSTDVGQEIDQVETNKKGKFRIELPVGAYVFEPLYGGNGHYSPHGIPSVMDLPQAQPQIVVVKPGVTRVSIIYSSGIR